MKDECMKDTAPLKFKDLEESLRSILELCYGLKEQLRITKDIIYFGVEQTVPPSNVVECKQEEGRYREMEHTINDINVSLSSTKLEIMDLKSFFEK